MWVVVLLVKHKLIVQLHFSKLFLILKSGVNHTSRGSISTSTLPSIKLRKCSSKIITSILSYISGRLATKSNQIKQLIRHGRSASLQRTFKKSFTSFRHSTRNKFFFSRRRRHTSSLCDWSSDVCSSDLPSTHAKKPDRTPVGSTSTPASAARTSDSKERAMPIPFSCCGQPSYASSSGKGRPASR